MKEEKTVKKGKIPGPFRKPLPEKGLEKRYLKHLQQPEDRKFFASCFEEREGMMVFREEPDRKTVKRVKALLREIKKNRKGPVKFLPLTAAAIVVAALAFFFTVLMNPLLEGALERGLEALFEARAEVDGFNLNLLRFRVGINRIAVANRDSPMKNLIETGRLEFRLKPEAVLRGKIYIEEIRADALRFGTDRQVSGTLPERPPKAKKQRPPKADTPPLVDLKNFDAMGLLNREYDKLASPKAYDAAAAAYNESAAKWKNEVESVRARVAELRNAAQPLLNIRADTLRDVQAIMGTVQEITTMVNTVEAAMGDANRIVGGIEDDLNTALALERSARTAITGDLDHLKSYLNFGSGAAFEALEPSIREILSDTAEQYLDYGFRALEILEKMKAEAAAKPKTEKPKKEPKVSFKGRDVRFPARAYPKFFLGVLASDFTLSGWNWGFDLRGVSSNPDISGVPVTLALSLAETAGTAGRNVGFKGSADFRTAATERFAAAVSGGGFPVSLGDQLAQAGIQGFKGDMAFALDFSGRTGGGVSGGGKVAVENAQLVDPSGTLAEAIDTALRQAKALSIGISYEHRPAGDDEFSITTNIVDLVKDALRRIVEAYAKKAADELEKALREKIAQYIDGKFVSKEELDALFRIARGDKSAADQLKNSLENRKNEFERKIRGAAGEAVDQAKQEAQRQAEQAVQDALQGKTPTLQTPSLPNLPGGLKLPGR
ncbi:MAG: hypothetical protein LBP23_03060 [Treponema sp.]|jgi:uncharacterized protein (TIGR03545 family)|nr:hypothetical protein [Treponema sp.]